jgi:hypothetical protein
MPNIIPNAPFDAVVNALAVVKRHSMHQSAEARFCHRFCTRLIVLPPASIDPFSSRRTA